MYQLEKYHGTNSRHTCPACGVKRVFSRYVTEANEPLADDVGRCNRESQCGHHYPPREYFAHQRETGEPLPRKITAPRTIARALEPSFIDANVFTTSLRNYEKNNFIRYLRTCFDEPTVQELIDRFGIGTSSDHRTVFWQIDEQGRLRTGKIIVYQSNGKRDKAIYPAWVHSRMQLPGFNLEQCLFGLHQIVAKAQKPIGIVEAEKTAIVATALIPDFVWLATGGKQNLKPEKFTTLRDRELILFPDGDAFDDWSQKAAGLRDVCSDITVNTLLHELLTDAEKADGMDLADVLGIEKSRTKATPTINQCKRCPSTMDHIEAGYFTCSECHYQMIQSHSGYWMKESEVL